MPLLDSCALILMLWCQLHPTNEKQDEGKLFFILMFNLVFSWESEDFNNFYLSSVLLFYYFDMFLF